MKTSLLLTLLAAVALAAPAAAVAAPAPARPAVSAMEASLRSALEAGASDFNKGDFEAYFKDFGARVSYNELLVERSRLLEINKDLKQAFPNLRMRYEKIRIVPTGAGEAAATTVAEFSAKTDDYEGSGLPATYRESGQVTALYRRAGGRWVTHRMQVAWNDSYIDVGAPFGVMGFSSLPTLVGTNQPFNFRLFVGDETRRGAATHYAHALVPLKAVLDTEGAEQVFGGLKFEPIGHAGVNKELRAPGAPGTYVHLLVVNKMLKLGAIEAPLGQKIYTRLVRVE